MKVCEEPEPYDIELRASISDAVSGEEPRSGMIHLSVEGT